MERPIISGRSDHRARLARSPEVLTVRTLVSLLVAVLVSGAALPARGGTVSGLVEVLERKGQRARDTDAVVVWVEGPKVRPEPVHATIVMHDKSFEPHLLVVPVGGTVSFPNHDPILHNAFSLSGDNRFDLDLYKKPDSRSVTFEHPGLVRVYCNIHPQMSAFVVVRDNPFWSRADANGRFSIPDVPPGEWVLKAWHERAGEIEKPIRVAATGDVVLDLTLDASKYKRSRHKNKYGKDYKQRRY